MPKSVTLAVRVPQEIRQRLEEKVVSESFGSLTDLLRNVLIGFALDSSVRESNRANGCKQQEVGLGYDKTCPVLSFARVELCNACPYREQPVTSRAESIEELLGNLRSMKKKS
jgi:hypothetical protein